MTMPTFAKELTNERFDELLELSSWMQRWSSAIEDTNHCEERYLDLQTEGEELGQAIDEAGFTYEQVETFAFDMAE